LSVELNRLGQRSLVRDRARPQRQKANRENRWSEALLTSEGASPSVLTRREAPC
jgi:hypothetical protein